jgi:hypothetical protein
MLIVHHQVTNDGNDSEQLARQAMAAKEVLGVDSLIAVADAGFCSEAQLAECAEANITAYVAIPDKHRAVSAEDRFRGAQFPYLPQVDAYICPGAKLLRPQGKPLAKRGVESTRYTCPAGQCNGCPQGRLPARAHGPVPRFAGVAGSLCPAFDQRPDGGPGGGCRMTRKPLFYRHSSAIRAP